MGRHGSHRTRKPLYPLGTVGSNPTPSAISFMGLETAYFCGFQTHKTSNYHIRYA